MTVFRLVALRRRLEREFTDRLNQVSPITGGEFLVEVPVFVELWAARLSEDDRALVFGRHKGGIEVTLRAPLENGCSGRMNVLILDGGARREGGESST